MTNNDGQVVGVGANHSRSIIDTILYYIKTFDTFIVLLYSFTKAFEVLYILCQDSGFGGCGTCEFI